MTSGLSFYWSSLIFLERSKSSIYPTPFLNEYSDGMLSWVPTWNSLTKKQMSQSYTQPTQRHLKVSDECLPGLKSQPCNRRKGGEKEGMKGGKGGGREDLLYKLLYLLAVN